MSNDIWQNKYSIQYRGGFPLRPPQEVANLFDKLVNATNKNTNKPFELILLGVTPELALINWPDNISLKAFDQSKEMIANVWQYNPKINSSVHLSTWQSLPLVSHTIDSIIGDGCTTQLSDKDTFDLLFNELHRVLKAEGHIFLRCFIRPDETESLSKISEDALGGKIKFFGSLKWRIAMSLVSHHKNMFISVNEIYKSFNELFPDREKLSAHTQWPIDMINTIDSYLGSLMQYNFPTLNEFEAMLPNTIKIREVSYGSYELSERCPILNLVSSSNH